MKEPIQIQQIVEQFQKQAEIMKVFLQLSGNIAYFQKPIQCVRASVCWMAKRWICAPFASRHTVRQLENIQNFWYNIYRKLRREGKLMDEFENLSPAEKETAIRTEYTNV